MKKYLMKVLFFLISTFAMSQTPALADIAIARNENWKVFSCAAANLDAARSCVLDHCEKNSGGTCNILSTSDRNTTGYMAVAQNNGKAWGVSTGFSTQEAAISTALRGCEKLSGTPCKITLEYLDRSTPATPASNQNSMINPASGLPMMQPGNCNGFDIQGNPYGLKL